jgi:phosphopantothenoylcysteine decarboxylase/phosphopantothenate--cysteine ligase
MMEPEDIVRRLGASFAPGDFAGLRVLVTAGRTEEEIDPVRYISNRSSGRMGFAIAREARSRGARVTIVHGAVDVPVPSAEAIVSVTSAAEMKRAVARAFPSCDICIMAAAVSDFAPSGRLPAKMKRSDAGFTLALRPTEDIIASVAKRKGARIVVGFALETENGEPNARRKAREKRCDYMVLNEPGPESGFAAPTNRITVFKGTAKLFDTPVVSKEEAARRLIDALARDRRIAGRKRRHGV